MIGRNAFQSTNGDWLVFDTTASTCGLARTIANATEDAGKDVGFAVDEVRLAEVALSDQAYVFGYIRVCGAGPLTIDDAMKIVGIASLGRFHLVGSP